MCSNVNAVCEKRNAPREELPKNRLAELSPKDKKWDDKKMRSSGIAEIFMSKPETHSRGQKMADCAKFLQFEVRDNPAEGQSKLKLAKAIFCHDRFCPVCNWRRGLRLQAKFANAAPLVEEKHNTTNWLFLTLTVRNCQVDDLRDTLSHMSKSWARLTKRADFKDAVVGWVRTVEFTRGEDGTAHPHFHVLLLVKRSYYSNNYISQAKWSSIWQESLQVDYTPIVNVKKVKAKKGEPPETGLRNAVAETLKYSVKDSDFLEHPEFLHAVAPQLRHMRFVASGGAFEKVFAEVETEKEIVDGDTLPDENAEIVAPKFIWMSWRERFKCYAQCAAPPMATNPPYKLPVKCESPWEVRRLAREATDDLLGRELFG
jgi:plasmid rolling circle replication initiator protein Rep